jgi:hypothetical protein
MPDRLLRLVALALCLVPILGAGLARGAVDLPPALRAHAPELRLLGTGRMTWFGLHLYDAALWVPGRGFDFSQPFALAIRYARDFQGRRIAQHTVHEIERLGIHDPAKLARWGAQMERIFPDVRIGDQLTGVYRPGLGADFYHQDRMMGSVADPEFARAFFSIWLDPRTREPKLRERLIGAHEQ